MLLDKDAPRFLSNKGIPGGKLSIRHMGRELPKKSFEERHGRNAGVTWAKSDWEGRRIENEVQTSPRQKPEEDEWEFVDLCDGNVTDFLR